MSADIDAAVDYLYTHGQKYAEAKGQRVYLEEWRKSQKAILMKKAISDGKVKSAASAEMEAYSDPTYQELLKTIQVAIEKEEGLRWGLVAAQARIEVFRTTEASNRMLDRGAM